MAHELTHEEKLAAVQRLMEMTRVEASNIGPEALLSFGGSVLVSCVASMLRERGDSRPLSKDELGQATLLLASVFGRLMETLEEFPMCMDDSSEPAMVRLPNDGVLH